MLVLTVQLCSLVVELSSNLVSFLSAYLRTEVFDHLQLAIVTGIVQGQPSIYLLVNIHPLHTHINTITRDPITYLHIHHLLHLVQVTILDSPGKVTHLSLR